MGGHRKVMPWQIMEQNGKLLKVGHELCQDEFMLETAILFAAKMIVTFMQLWRYRNSRAC